ncbi:methyltransferase domain-containing protein [Sphingomonas sp. LB2R24]|uniref:methyltransferase domain-containing protein n=1 Tax=Sphingomonas sorbitolis TaxID=3096165 RepID=UPI002FCC5DA7
MNVHALPVRLRTAVGGNTSRHPSKAAVQDPRWPQIEGALSALRTNGRHAVRIVDAQCGAGTLLLHALAEARRLGFTAIEGHGIDRSPLLIGRARSAAHRVVDPAIGLDFEAADMVTALRDEQDLPADIVICHDSARARQPDARLALCKAGRIVIDDQASSHDRDIAA